MLAESAAADAVCVRALLVLLNIHRVHLLDQESWYRIGASCQTERRICLQNIVYLAKESACTSVLYDVYTRPVYQHLSLILRRLNYGEIYVQILCINLHINFYTYKLHSEYSE